MVPDGESLVRYSQKTVRKQVGANELQEVLGRAHAGGACAVLGAGGGACMSHLAGPGFPVSHQVLWSLTLDVERGQNHSQLKAGGFGTDFPRLRS